jgi:PIN domain nuclease of toxin-antitoxin system
MVAADDRQRSRRLDRGPLKVLADTHALVWALTDPQSLSSKARQALSQAEVNVSVASLWELILKKGKPGALLADPLLWWEKYIVKGGITTLTIRTAHVMAVGHLPDIHRDPFDRILVAQSQVEGMPLVSKDENLRRYGVPVVW